MSIEINTEMVAKASAETRAAVEGAAGRVNFSLSICRRVSEVNAGFKTSAALQKCVDAWGKITGDLVNKTVETADDLSATAQCVNYTEDENRRAAAALQGLL